MTAKEIARKYLINPIQVKSLAYEIEEYGKTQYNQCLYDLIADDLLPDKEKNLKKYLKK